MKKLILSGNYEVLLDDEDYEEISKMSGWYVQKKENLNARTNYVVHDTYGRLHRYLLGVTDRNIIIDHIDRNGLNNQRKNLRITTQSENKKNANLYGRNKFHFNGLSFEAPKNNRKWRIKVSYSTLDRVEGEKRFQQRTKSFGPANGDNFNEAIRKAILFRIEKMREFGYIIDERSETIEKQCQNPDANMGEILGIKFSDFNIGEQSRD